MKYFHLSKQALGKIAEQLTIYLHFLVSKVKESKVKLRKVFIRLLMYISIRMTRYDENACCTD